MPVVKHGRRTLTCLFLDQYATLRSITTHINNLGSYTSACSLRALASSAEGKASALCSVENEIFDLQDFQF